MKTRIGFVSNSSSSSYLLIVPKEAHEQVCSTFDEKEIEVLDYVSKSVMVLGQEAVCLAWSSGNMSSFDINQFGDTDPFDVLWTYRAAMKKVEGVFVHTESF
jgi:hypothetical protein